MAKYSPRADYEFYSAPLPGIGRLKADKFGVKHRQPVDLSVVGHAQDGALVPQPQPGDYSLAGVPAGGHGFGHVFEGAGASGQVQLPTTIPFSPR